jgi:urease accessory protein
MIAAARLALALVFSTAPQLALAHSAVQGVGGFYGGLVHPLLVPAHLLALLALGLLAGQQDPPHRRAVMISFAAGLVAGIGAILAAYAFESVTSAVYALGVASGLLVALARPLPLILTGPLAVSTGAAIVLDSVPDEISMSAAFLALAGTGIGAYLLLMLVADVTAMATRASARIAVRVLGSWTAASAALVLALRFARPGG